jgi:peptidoglycan/xylan/chitin deacetylase (PgdA/CDA1 family)
MSARSTTTINELSGALRELKRATLSSVLAWSHLSGAADLVARRYGGKGSILMFHSIVKNIEQQLGQSIHVQESVLWDIIIQLQKMGRDVVTIDEGMRRLSDSTSQNFVVLTFDDGYRNNLTNALPVLEALSAPFMIYVNSNMVNGEGDVWWLGLRDMLLAQDSVEIEPMGLTFSTNNIGDKRKALLLITDWVHKNMVENAKELKNILLKYKVDIKGISRREALNLEELKLLSRNKLVTIGGHAETHLPLNLLGELDVLGEMARNKQMLENIIQREVRHFAYPFGERNAAGTREAMLASSVGFETAVTTRLGNLFLEHASRPFMLPRLTVVNQDRNAQILAKMAGVEKLLRQPFKSPVSK